jgi:hypothetical protein
MNQKISYFMPAQKPRNLVAKDMFDRNGPYKPKKDKKVQHQRHDKHRNRQDF